MTYQNLLDVKKNRTAEAVERAKRQRFSELLEIYKDKVFGVAYNMALQNREEAEDLVQETFLRAYKFFDKYDPDRPFDSWILTILRNIQIDKVRKKAPFTIKSVDDNPYDSAADRYNYADESQKSIEEQIIDKDDSQKIMEQINSLPEHFRTVILYADVEEMCYSQIAEITGTNVGTVRSRIHRGRKLLKEKLQKAGITYNNEE